MDVWAIGEAGDFLEISTCGGIMEIPCSSMHNSSATISFIYIVYLVVGKYDFHFPAKSYLDHLSRMRVLLHHFSFARLPRSLRLFQISRRRMQMRGFHSRVWMDVLRLGDHIIEIVIMSQLKFLSSRDTIGRFSAS